MEEREAMLARINKKIKLVPDELLGVLLDVVNKLTNLGGRTGFCINLKKFLRKEDPGFKSVEDEDGCVIDLVERPRLQFKNTKVIKHECKINGKGVVEIELRPDDNLYIDDEKVVLQQSERQMGDRRIDGHEVLKDLENRNQILLNSNVLDYLYDHPEFFPEHWKKDDNGRMCYICFWGSVFHSILMSNPYVRYLYWNAGVLNRDCLLLDREWHRLHWSASIIS